MNEPRGVKRCLLKHQGQLAKLTIRNSFFIYLRKFILKFLQNWIFKESQTLEIWNLF